MILYIVFVEIFLVNMRQNSSIKKCIVIGEEEPKASAFADNTTKYIRNNNSLAHLETQLMHFEKAQTYSKTKCTRI